MLSKFQQTVFSPPEMQAFVWASAGSEAHKQNRGCKQFDEFPLFYTLPDQNNLEKAEIGIKTFNW